MQLRWTILFICSLASFGCWAQDVGDVGDFGEIDPGRFRAGVGMGFSYDLLRDPTRVSFDMPEGKAAFNIPLSIQLPGLIGSAFDQLIDTSSLASGASIQPELKAGQELNLGFRVDVPMIGGVCSFGYINNVDINYFTTMGNGRVDMQPDLMEGLSFVMKGYINVPLDARLGWRTMTFGYAYRPIRGLVLALNMHRHVFELEGTANLAMDLLGNASLEIEDLGSLSLPINYTSSKFYGHADTDYRARAWSPTFGVRVWRVGLVSRFGVDTKAEGSFDARYSLPFFVDPQTFEMTLSEDNLDSLLQDGGFRNDLLLGRTDSVTYHSTNPATWKLPQGHTLSFDIVRNKLFISYTKIIGDIEMKHIYEGNDGDLADTTDNRNDLDLAVSVDNIILISGKFFGSHFNLGLFTMDLRVFEDANLLGKNYPEFLKFLGGPVLPILSVGSSVGGSMRMMIQADVLPLPSFKTGMIYHF